jgi:hypothetical protein
MAGGLLGVKKIIGARAAPAAQSAGRAADSRPEPAAVGWFSVDPLRLAGGVSQHHGAAGYGKAAAGIEYLLIL